MRPDRESPRYQSYYWCYSRGAALRCMGWKPDGAVDFFEFVYITVSERGAKHRGEKVGDVELIQRDNLAPLVEISELEVLARVAQ